MRRSGVQEGQEKLTCQNAPQNALNAGKGNEKDDAENPYQQGSQLIKKSNRSLSETVENTA